nr:unnamed protein product [Callosobruchus analis]
MSYKVGNITDEQYKEHILKKNRARSEKETDKKLAEEGKCVVLTMDLQAVKVCPFVQSSKVFFKTKLCCHNFTIYDLTSRHCTYYWFTEYDYWKQLPSRHKASNEVPIYPPLNKSKLPIKKSKFDHLQALKTLIAMDDLVRCPDVPTHVVKKSKLGNYILKCRRGVQTPAPPPGKCHTTCIYILNC